MEKHASANPINTGASSPKKSTLALTLIIAWLGWMFDGMEMGLYSQVIHPALKDLTGIQNPEAVAPYVGLTMALFLIGMSVGGVVFGRLGDRIGRVRTMVITVLVYAVFTGLSGFVRNWQELAVCRFLGATGLGGEWGLGVALVMETWPNTSRPVLAGLLGGAANFGFLAASLVGLNIDRVAAMFGAVGLGGLPAWRYVLVVGFVPAVLTFFIRLAVKEPERWVKSHARGEASALSELFSPRFRSRTVVAALCATVAVLGTWVYQWVPTWVNAMGGPNAAHNRAAAQFWMAIGAIVGAFLGGYTGNWLERRKTYAFFCATSLISGVAMWLLPKSFGAELLAWACIAGVFTTSLFGWLPLYLPELFPTRIRATGEGFTFNAGRVLAAVGVFTTGPLVKAFGSYPKAGATMMLIYLVGFAIIWLAPETHGEPLPD